MKAGRRALGTGAAPAVPENVSREKRLRYRLMKRGFRLHRRRSRSLPSGERGYAIIEFASGQVVAGGEPVAFSLTLEAAEAWESGLPGAAICTGCAPDPGGAR